jgi:Uma2 family endonuclease
MGEAAKDLRSVYEQFLAVPEHLVAEIIRGALVTQARPAPRHLRAATRLTQRLGPFDRDEEPGGWIILAEPELHLSENITVPDLAGWRRQRMPSLPDTAYFELAPDWICEVLSPGTQTLDRKDKMPIYAEHRVAHAWLIDPIAKMLETYRLQEGKWLQLGVWAGDSRVRAEPFDAIELDLSVLWTP